MIPRKVKRILTTLTTHQKTKNKIKGKRWKKSREENINGGIIIGRKENDRKEVKEMGEIKSLCKGDQEERESKDDLYVPN
jgi:hypothetical protein